MTASDEFLDVLERWLDAKILWADESVISRVAILDKTNDADKRMALVSEIGWLHGYVVAFNELRGYVKRPHND